MSVAHERIAYFDCVGGASGDMLLAALIDAGAPLELIQQALSSLPIQGWSLTTAPARRGALRALRVCVNSDSDPGDDRTLADIEVLLVSGALPNGVAARAREVFRRLAHAEACVHGTAPEATRLHAVGATDAIIDVVGVITALALLEVGSVYASSVPLAVTGQSQSGHGPVPLPAPATLELLRSVAAPLRAADPRDDVELVTPTGAALLAGVRAL